MSKAILAALMCFLLFVAPTKAETACPRGRVGYSIAEGKYLYGEKPDCNSFGVYVEGQGSVWWIVKSGCYVIDVCVADESLHWLGPMNQGCWEGGDHIVFWGGCQVPGMPPPRAWLPLVVKGE